MKKLTLIVAFILACGTLFAQQPLHSWSSTHYQISSDESEAYATEVSQKIEAAFRLFSELFHFEPSQLDSKLKVRIFSQKADYDVYLQQLISEVRSDFVFISYSDPARNELVGFIREQPEFDTSLLHYGFIQYLNAYIPSAPLWLEEGMAVYLEMSRFDPDSGSFTWQPNMVWLDSLKTMLQGDIGEGGLTLSDLTRMDMASAQDKIDLFYPLAWGLIHFLMNSPEQRINRILWDSISALERESTMQENSERVVLRAFSWIEEEALQESFSTFVFSLRTFNELIKEGVDLYSSEQPDLAETYFLQALELKGENHIPHYYLGLISYDRKDYQSAYNYYITAQEFGIDPGLISYALGVNAFADGQYVLAESYLLEATEFDADTFGEKADSLLRRIEYLR